jgi:large subunit ribosomal protein L31e
MAESKEMTIPLRAAWAVPRTQRAARAIKEIRKHVTRHMKVTEDEDLWIDEAVNHAIWARGIQKPPRKIRVVATREEGFPIEIKLVEE